MTRSFRHRRVIFNTLIGMTTLAFAATSPVAWSYYGWGKHYGWNRMYDRRAYYDWRAHYDEEEIQFSKGNIFFELNDTDGDLGIHALIDGDAWKQLEIEDPRGRKMLDIRVKGRLQRQGLTELFFESAEPNFDQLSPEEFFQRFPEGEYEIEGKTLEGEELEGEAELSHVMPAPPGMVTINGIPARPADGSDCNEDELPVVSNPVIIRWEAVTGSHPDIGREGNVEIVRYQAIAEFEDDNENVFVSSIDISPDHESVYSVTVAPEFFRGGEIKFEVAAKAFSGNNTVVESCPFEFKE